MKAILIGPPGAGKGTQAAILRTEHDFHHIASGDLLRAAVAAGTDLGREAKTYMERGELVPDEIVIGMILERLKDEDPDSNVIFDGFPRTLEQARALEEALEPTQHGIDAVLYIDVPREVLFERLTSREQCTDCGAIYNWTINPPKVEGLCDRCGGGLYQRMDDNERTVERRLGAYFRQTMPLIQHYEAEGRLQRIDGTLPIREVTAEILGALERVAALAENSSD
jgi:adenylate kinase